MSLLCLIRDNLNKSINDIFVLGFFSQPELMDSMARHEKEVLVDFLNLFQLIRLDTMEFVGSIVDLDYGDFVNPMLVKVNHPYLPMVCYY